MTPNTDIQRIELKASGALGDDAWMAAIDLGTTTTTIAIAQAGKVLALVQGSNPCKSFPPRDACSTDRDQKAPMAILLDQHGALKAFGGEAYERWYSDFDDGDVYAKYFKMALKDASGSMDEVMFQAYGGEVPLMLIMVRTLELCGATAFEQIQLLDDSFRRGKKGLKDLHFCLTVPVSASLVTGGGRRGLPHMLHPKAHVAPPPPTKSCTCARPFACVIA
jgi:hypothetical protein